MYVLHNAKSQERAERASLLPPKLINGTEAAQNDTWRWCRGSGSAEACDGCHISLGFCALLIFTCTQAPRAFGRDYRAFMASENAISVHLGDSSTGGLLGGRYIILYQLSHQGSLVTRINCLRFFFLLLLFFSNSYYKTTTLLHLKWITSIKTAQ